jgi:glycosyltransferase involved in cell wall biosynthesis
MVKVSILIPLYNGVEFLEECIDSVIQQTFGEWEALIGINGHGDDGGEVAKIAGRIASKDDRIKIIIQGSEISGKVMSLHNLVSLAKADLICILDCDDKWHPHKLKRQMETLAFVTPDTAVIGTFCKYFGEKTLDLVLDSGYINPAALETCNQIINSSTMIKKEYCVWHDEEYTFGVEDYFLWMNICLQGKKLYNIPEFLTYHRIHNTSAFNSSHRQHMNVEIIRKQYIELRKQK